MELRTAVDQFYYHMTLSELRRMNKSDMLPNVSYNTLLYLDLIEMTPNCTASGLATALHISKPAVAVKVAELLRKGLVVKRQSESDRRVFYLEVVPDAVKEYREYDVAVNRALSRIQESYTPDEIEAFCSILATFCQSYNEE